MIEVIVESIRVSLINQLRLVVLREKNGVRFLPIWIGAFEADAITMGLQNAEVSRPMTHDLLSGAINEMGGSIEYVCVAALRDDTFYAHIHVEAGDKTVDLDARPSDAIALAVRAKVRIFVDEDVMERAGQVPTDDDDEDAIDARASRKRDEGASKGRRGRAADDTLDVFRDFVEGINLDDAGKSQN